MATIAVIGAGLAGIVASRQRDGEYPHDDTDAVLRHLADEFCRITGIDPARARFIDVRRWRYANVDRQGGDVCALDTQLRLAACGDRFVHGRVEGAFASADALAKRMRDAASRS
jgi:predicted NAD/FAD-dependent oxidoreductase